MFCEYFMSRMIIKGLLKHESIEMHESELGQLYFDKALQSATKNIKTLNWKNA